MILKVAHGLEGRDIIEPRWVYSVLTAATLLFSAIVFGAWSAIPAPSNAGYAESCFSGMRIVPNEAFVLLSLLTSVFMFIPLSKVRENFGIRRDILIICLLLLVIIVSTILPAFSTSLGELQSRTGFTDGIQIAALMVLTYVNVWRPYRMISLFNRRTGSVMTVDAGSDKVTTLEGVLRHPQGNTAFRVFLTREFAVENVVFWNFCEKFRKESPSMTPEQRSQYLQRLHAMFLQETSKLEVNLPMDKMNRLLEGIGATRKFMDLERGKKATDDVLEEAQHAILHLMQINYWQRFKQTAPYQNLVTKLAQV